MTANKSLMELLCTRLCHDIAGPVGAIANGAEFLAEENSGMHDQAIELITQSAEEAVNRLQFYRMAYGKITGKGDACLADYKTLIKKFFQSGKISLDWPDTHTDAANIPLSRNMARLILNLVLLASGTLIRGGVISIRIQQRENERVILISASGTGLKWDIMLERAIHQTLTIDELEPHTVQAYFTGLITEELGIKLGIQHGTDTFEFSVTQNEFVLEN